MKQFALFFLLIPLIHGEFDLLLDCETSPYQLGRFCYSEYYFTVPSNYSCSTLYFTDGDTYLLSLEMLNIEASDKVTISWDNTTVRENRTAIHRQGFLMTNFYPFYLSNMYGGSLDLEAVAYSYKITLTATTNAPSKANAFLEFDKNGTAFQKLAFDVHTNVGTPIVMHVEANTYRRINLWGGSGPSHGSYGTYFIGDPSSSPGELTNYLTG